VKSADGNNAGMLLELDAILAVTLGGTRSPAAASAWPAA
jgi:ribose/xylose/arabinose/galactoside ABC-type transport system permease subunit